MLILGLPPLTILWGGWPPVLAALFAHGFYFWSDWGQAFD
jgi:hypothetical protein